jgi:hypothetical protein
LENTIMPASESPAKSKSTRKPLTPWELPQMLTPMHLYHKGKKKRPVERPHCPRILAFVYRSRFAVASQIQRRFADVLKSDRTTRRHLEEMESLGYLGVAPARGTSPLFPKIYYVTGRGVRHLRECMAKQGKSWEATRVDRRGRHAREGYGAEKLLHEIMTTEFLLAVWQQEQKNPDLKILTIQRRSLVKHSTFRFTMNGRYTQLIPDAMFLARHPEGMVCYFVEIDTGTMNRKQLVAKFNRYVTWASSTAGQQYLFDLYRRHGAQEPRAVFRLLVIVKDRSNTDDRRRLKQFGTVVKKLPDSLKKRLWLTSVSKIQAEGETLGILTPNLWQIGEAGTR